MNRNIKKIQEPLTIPLNKNRKTSFTFQSMGSGSVSSENRSISPTQSDDSRSVSPPIIQKSIVAAPQDPTPTTNKPKPPQRKRRPAPKPPTENPVSQISSNTSESSVVETQKKTESTLTICHSRNSSDSSGYHEASILSENCTLPRKFRPIEEMSGRHSQSTTNLSKMSTHSKSTSSLVHAGKNRCGGCEEI